jgi:hypothetical protein
MAVRSLNERYSSSRLEREDKAVGEISVRRFDGRASSRNEDRLSNP